jgi:hypothetical protein
LIALDWSGRLFKAGLHEAAGALFRVAQKSQWAEDKVLAISVASREDAKTLRGCWQELAKLALDENLKKVLLAWPGARRPYPILASMALEHQDSEKAISALLGDRLEINAMRLAERVLDAELPTSLVCMQTDLQIWTNRPLANLLNVSMEESRRLNMRDHWIRDGVDDGLERMKRTLRYQSRLELNYQTVLIGSIRCDFKSSFELELDGRYRLTTIYSADPIAPRVSV